MRPAIATILVLTTFGWVSASAAESAIDDPLPRRGFLGAQLMAVPPEWREMLRLGPQQGAIITGIIPGTAASLLDVRQYDVLIRVGDLEVSGDEVLPEIVSTISRHRDGDVLPFTFIRNGQEVTENIRLMGLQKEMNPKIDVVYSALKAGPIWQRTIITKPKGAGPFPIVVYFQDYGCESLDQPYPPYRPIRQFAHTLAELGVAVMRIEKPGIGDSEGPPCTECGFETERAAFDAAVPYAKSVPFVDANDVHIFGHGTGGVSAALAAAKYDVASVIVFGTYCRPFKDHLHRNELRFAAVSGIPESKSEETVALADKYFGMLLDEKKAPYEILFDCPELDAYVEVRDGDDSTKIFGVDYRYWQELNAVNVDEVWSNVDDLVLALWGDADYASGQEDHQRIADIVNANHPKNAVLWTVPGTGHKLDTATSIHESFAHRMYGPFNPLIAHQVQLWTRGGGR